eukprot:5244310-Amphidinium_carterae.1
MSSVRRSFEVSQARLRQLSANMDRLAELEAISQKHGSAQAKSQQDLNSLQTECAQMQSNIAAMQKDIEGLNKKFTQVKAFAASEKSPQSRGRHTDAWNARWAAENVRWSTEIVRVTKEWDSRFLQGSQDLGQMVADSEDPWSKKEASPFHMFSDSSSGRESRRLKGKQKTVSKKLQN